MKKLFLASFLRLAVTVDDDDIDYHDGDDHCHYW